MYKIKFSILSEISDLNQTDAGFNGLTILNRFNGCSFIDLVIYWNLSVIVTLQCIFIVKQIAM